MAEISNRAVATAAAGALLAVGLAFVSSADASHQYDDAVRCNGQTVRNVQLLERSRDGAVFRKLKPTPEGRRVSTAYACLLRSGSVTRLGFANRVGEPALAGRFVAFQNTIYVSEFGAASGIQVVDLKTGQVKVDEQGVPGHEGDSNILAFVVKRNGSVAWTGMGDGSPNVSVWKVDSTASGPQELDRGPQIDAESLALRADRTVVQWQNGSAVKTAPLT